MGLYKKQGLAGGKDPPKFREVCIKCNHELLEEEATFCQTCKNELETKIRAREHEPVADGVHPLERIATVLEKILVVLEYSTLLEMKRTQELLNMTEGETN